MSRRVPEKYYEDLLVQIKEFVKDCQDAGYLRITKKDLTKSLGLYNNYFQKYKRGKKSSKAREAVLNYVNSITNTPFEKPRPEVTKIVETPAPLKEVKKVKSGRLKKTFLENVKG